MTIDVKSEVGANVWKVLVAPGERVAADQTVVILECMKMEINVDASEAGTVTEILIGEGDAVDEGDVLFKFSPG